MDTHIKSIKLALATVLWTAAVGLAVTGTVYGNLLVLIWAALALEAACVVTNHMITETTVKNDRQHIERMIDGLIAGAEGKDVDRIH